MGDSKAERRIDLEALNQHEVCRACLQGENRDEKPSLVLLNDVKECPVHGRITLEENRISGALLFCFLQVLDLDSKATINHRREV